MSFCVCVCESIFVCVHAYVQYMYVCRYNLSLTDTHRSICMHAHRAKQKHIHTKTARIVLRGCGAFAWYFGLGFRV